jgi:hypothetical protein
MALCVPIRPSASFTARPVLIIAFCVVIGAAGPFDASVAWGKGATETSSFGSPFAIDPDLMIRSILPEAPDNMWALGQGWGLRPFFYRSRLPGLYTRLDFLYPLGCFEDTNFRRKFRLTPFFESWWSKSPPYEGHARFLTVFKGVSDLGQRYWGIFPFYGYTHRRFGVDSNFFVLFPLYYHAVDEGSRTVRILWPLITYANSPSRSALKVWPLFGRDRIRNDYDNFFVLWPFFQKVEKYPGTEQESRYLGLPFPLFVKQDDHYSTATHILWPLVTYYYHYQSGHTRYSFRPFITYGTGGGVEELSILSLYTYKEDNRRPSTSKDSEGYVSVAADEIMTERTFLGLSAIKKRYRKGCLVYARYRFWPFAEYIWDAAKGSHLKIPELIPLTDQWWDLNMGRLLRIVDIRDTPVTRELSLFFGLRQKTEMKQYASIDGPPLPGDDDWKELIMGAFGKQ